MHLIKLKIVKEYVMCEGMCECNIKKNPTSFLRSVLETSGCQTSGIYAWCLAATIKLIMANGQSW